MQRRQFIRNLAWLAGGGVASSFFPIPVAAGHKKKFKGRVLSQGRGIEGVVLSDGYSVVATDRKGKYEMETHPDAIALFVSTPSGYAFAHEEGIARHYRMINEIRDRKEVDFRLEPLGVNDDEHQFLVWADPQVRNAKDVEKMMKQSVPDVQKYLASVPAGTLVHGITVGDIAWDDLRLFDDYNKAVQQMRIPFFQCLGNHDMDYNKGGDETSDDTFCKYYGPTYYSFNRGKVHYVVMDDVRYLGKDREYDGYIAPHQLEWLKKDLAFVPSDRLIILCVHIPVHSGVKNNQELYAILGNRNVHIMSGHTHYNVNAIRDNIYEHNHGTVCGAWWTGPICGDGTPSGYAVYKVNGTGLTWHYQSTGQEADHQFRTFLSDQVVDSKIRKELQVNIWNYDPSWKTEYWTDGKFMGALEQYEGFDPEAYVTMLGPDLPKPRGFAEPKKTNHLFRAILHEEPKEIRIVVTDRFGKKFTRTELLS